MKWTGIFKACTIICLTATITFICVDSPHQVSVSPELKLATSSTRSHNGIIKHSEWDYAVEINSIDDVVSLASNIVIGTVTGVEDDEDNDSMYTVSVEKNLKGTVISKEIDVYETYASLHIGEKCVLLLTYNDSTLYPRGCYTSVYKDYIIMLSTYGLKGQYSGSEELIAKIEKCPGMKIDNSHKFEFMNEASSIEELAALSDNIIHFIPTEIQLRNKNSVLSKINIIKEYKGNLPQGDYSHILPAEVQVGKEYIIFLKKQYDLLQPTTRKGSLVCREAAVEWKKVLEVVK